jgi:hypothetical protein
MEVVTLERLSRRAARRAKRRFELRSALGDREGGTRMDLRLCRRAGAKAFTCQAVQVQWSRGAPDRRRCAGVWTARLRPDGLRSRLREAPRACRAAGPVR